MLLYFKHERRTQERWAPSFRWHWHRSLCRNNSHKIWLTGNTIAAMSVSGRLSGSATTAMALLFFDRYQDVANATSALATITIEQVAGHRALRCSSKSIGVYSFQPDERCRVHLRRSIQIEDADFAAESARLAGASPPANRYSNAGQANASSQLALQLIR